MNFCEVSSLITFLNNFDQENKWKPKNIIEKRYYQSSKNRIIKLLNNIEITLVESEDSFIILKSNEKISKILEFLEEKSLKIEYDFSLHVNTIINEILKKIEDVLPLYISKELSNIKITEIVFTGEKTMVPYEVDFMGCKKLVNIK
jgi:hypothetical protein